ncbi:hypothetical protein L910_2860 [Vibrio fluvialis PG41]|uniref:Uncharacterized protein n=1 Tax=Vibrio fluvialis PG41 TaxID=1336752 RepID=S7HVD9_VIBFL|nr:hypothetical protein L910_2860 [Vibrio fluvialis PG41]
MNNNTLNESYDNNEQDLPEINVESNPDIFENEIVDEE